MNGGGHQSTIVAQPTVVAQSTVVAQRTIVRLAPARGASIRLLCFPQAGGGTATFHPLTATLTATVDLCAVRLPGRETRRREPSIHRMDDAVATVVDALDTMDRLPLALLGYCSGSFVAYQVARELVRTGRGAPTQLIVLASPAPRLVAPDRWVHPLPEPELVDYLRRTRITPEEILAEPALFKIFEPVIRADFETYETWPYQPGPPLDLPVTVIGAREDASVDFDDLATWCPHTSQDLTLRIEPGGHDFLGTAAAAARLGRALLRELPPLVPA